MDAVETIAAIATPPGRGGVAVVRISGPESFAVASRVTGRTVCAQDAGRFFRAAFRGADGRTVDDGIMLVFAAPHSYTGEDVIECQGHGGSVSPRRVLEAVLSAGARLARRGEFTLRAFLNGRLDLSSAEAVIDLVDAKTARAADDARIRLGGVQRTAFSAFYGTALDLSARMEHALDFSEEELPGGFLAQLADAVDALARDVARHLATAREGRLLREGAHVVLAGPPNAGKSSLMNALLGEHRALVSPIAGTTRDSVEEWLELDGWPVHLADTAGLRETADVVEAQGVARARALMARADLVVALDCDMPGALRVHAKCDLGPGEGLCVSAHTGEGLDALKAAIVARLETASARDDERARADVTTRQKELLDAAAAALARARAAWPDCVLAAGALRQAAEAFGALTGKVYSEDLLDRLFSRFCVGK